MHVFIPVWFIVLLAAVVAPVLAGYLIARICRHAPDGAPCRTANARTMANNVHQLQKQVPSAPRPHLRAGQSPLPPQQHPGVNLQQVRAQAIGAALRDIGKRAKTPNPYPPGAAGHITWAQNYDRLTGDQRAVQASIQADAAHSSAAQPHA